MLPELSECKFSMVNCFINNVHSLREIQIVLQLSQTPCISFGCLKHPVFACQQYLVSLPKKRKEEEEEKKGFPLWLLKLQISVLSASAILKTTF